MRSSTSSSDDRFPGGNWGRTWLLAAVLVAAAFAMGELLWRSQGFRASVPDREEAWAVERDRLRPDSLVLVGTSRLQAAIDPEIWAGSGDGRWPLQLSIAGGSPLPVLEDLAGEERFRGVAVVDVVPSLLFGGEQPLQEARERVAAYPKLASSPGRMLEARIRIALAEALVSLRMSPFEFANRAFVRTTPGRILYFTMTSRRSLKLDFARANLPRRIELTLDALEQRSEAPPEAETAAIVERFAAAVAAIRSRGGEVVLVHLPHDAAVRERERELRPRKRYWNRLVAASAALAIHFEDHAALTGFRCPDGSHLDVADTDRFTRALAAAVRDELERRSVAAATRDRA